MKSILIIITLLTSAILSYGQTPSSYDKILLAKINTLDSIVKVQGGQINTLVWSNTKLLAMVQQQDEIIKSQNEKIQANTDDIAEMKRMIVPFNKITYTPPLNGIVDEKFPNLFTVWLDIPLLKQLLGLQ